MCDVSPSSLLIAAERGIAVACIPIISSTHIPLAELIVRHSVIAAPADLAGKRIGVRTWTNPVKPWLTGMLQHDFGVDMRDVRWVVTVKDPLPGVALPAGAIRVEGRSLGDLLASGEIDAAISPGAVDLPGAGALFSDAVRDERSWYARSGIVPVMHLPVVRRALLTEWPQAAEVLIAGFTAGRTRYLAELASGEPAATDTMARRDDALQRELDADPVPLGIEAFRASFERLGDYMVEQGYLRQKPDLNALFIASNVAGSRR